MLPDGVRVWIAENYLLGCSRDEIVQTMTSAGLCATEVSEALASFSTGDPVFVAGNRIAQRLRKLESLMAIRQTLREIGPVNRTIPRISGIEPQKFLEDFYSANRPVVLTGLMDNWPALRLWSPTYFSDRFGDEVVEVMSGRSSDPDYDINMRRHKTKMPLRTFCEAVEKRGKTNDFYLVANNFFFDDARFKPLLDDLGYIPGLLEKIDAPNGRALFFGPAGTTTQPHHDLLNTLLGQVYGRKSILLAAPEDTPYLYNYRGVYSEVDWDNPDLVAFPLFEKAKLVEVIIHPGEMLFIPVGWWHYVKSLDVSISVSFGNFPFPNDFDAVDPDIALL